MIIATQHHMTHDGLRCLPHFATAKLALVALPSVRTDARPIAAHAIIHTARLVQAFRQHYIIVTNGHYDQHQKPNEHAFSLDVYRKQYPKHLS